jgi:hypothetical protein
LTAGVDNKKVRFITDESILFSGSRIKNFKKNMLFGVAPYGLDLSNFVVDFQAIAILLNSSPAIKQII